MCGISGIAGASENQAVERMVGAMHHRGPDDRGIWKDEHAALGMTRLAVIDLSPGGHQPMSTPDGRYWIVYNGEIYNFQEEKHLLEQKGHTFVSHSDTEAILHLYQEYGAGCLAHLRGMFAFAIWDAFERSLFAARDQLGIKPFLYSELPDKRFVFASELKALLASGLVQKEVDWGSFQNYLLLGSVQPPRTMLEGVKALLPGQYLTYKDGNLKIYTYWDVTPETTPSPFQGDARDAAQELRRLFFESVCEQQVSDVPVGVFLSGGLDSASVLAFMARSSSLPVKSFSVGFEKTNGNIDETDFAAQTARYIGSEHYRVAVDGGEVGNSFEHFVSGLDQPSIDGLNSYFVSRFARTKVTVALSGVGGDELFAGYSRARRILTGQSAPAFFRSRAFRSAGLGAANLAAKLSLKYADRVKDHLADRFDLLADYSRSHQVFSEYELARYMQPEFWDKCPPATASDPLKYIDRDDFADTWKRISNLEINAFMAPQLLRDMDAVGMIHSLEVRFPLLDLRIVDFARSLPLGLVFNKPANGDLSNAGVSYATGLVKRILVEAVQDVLPAPLIQRRKTGFEMPYRSWLDGSLSARVQDVLLSEGSHTVPFSGDAVKSIFKEHMNNRISWKKVWALLVFFEWKRLALQ